MPSYENDYKSHVPLNLNDIISAEVDEAVFVPVMFALLPDKRQTTYEDMFGIIKDCLNSRHLELSAEWFMSDFEVGIRNGFSLHFPEVTVKGCHFHMAKAFWKRVVNKGFKTVYIDSKNHPQVWGVHQSLYWNCLLPPQQTFRGFGRFQVSCK